MPLAEKHRRALASSRLVSSESDEELTEPPAGDLRPSRRKFLYAAGALLAGGSAAASAKTVSKSKSQPSKKPKARRARGGACMITAGRRRDRCDSAPR